MPSLRDEAPLAARACQHALVVREAATAMLRSARRHAFRFVVWVSLTGSPSRVPVRKTQTTNQEYRQRSLHEDLQAAAQAQHQVLRSAQSRKAARTKMATDITLGQSQKAREGA